MSAPPSSSAITNANRKGDTGQTLDTDLIAVIADLANNETLAPRYRDHALSGEWSDHRDCHIKPDLVLIYRRSDEDSLQLVRLGSHAELSL